MSVNLRKPSERTCERCDRREAWNEEVGSWVVDEEAGSVYCIHEWNINGAFVPFEEP